ncbi:30S ribosomal protein S17 [Candidatus Woesearchaeota archaeon]|nr:30S ribosomal protein S17 [Candidatus Woesearchaeota archaeon]
MKARNIGVEVASPEKECNDAHCPFHSNFGVRGRTFEGIVIRNPFHRTAVIEFQRLFYLHKYERYEKRRTRIKAHVPGCFDVTTGNKVVIMESRPISKTKNFVVLEVKK